MSNAKKDKPELKGLPEPEFRKRKRGISIVWLVPLVALAIGGWLVYKAVSEKGPTVTITFKSADGLEAGKTKIKYKDVELGEVDSIVLSKDLSQVIVKAELVKEAESFISHNTRFWVVRARVAAGQVTGLGTLFSGAYIGIDPSREGKPMRHFKGLEKQPIVTGEVPGRKYRLAANRLGERRLGLQEAVLRAALVGGFVTASLQLGLGVRACGQALAQLVLLGGLELAVVQPLQGLFVQAQRLGIRAGDVPLEQRFYQPQENRRGTYALAGLVDQHCARRGAFNGIVLAGLLIWNYRKRGLES